MGIHEKEVLKNVSLQKYFKDIILPNMIDYYDDGTYSFDWCEETPVIRCPLHDEDTPSFRYYPETETCSCFGCRKGGNVIQLHRHFSSRMSGTEIDNATSEAFLYNYFILGKRTTEYDVVKTQKKKQNNDNIALVSFNKYITELEKSIVADKSISVEHKIKIYDIIDKGRIIMNLDETDLYETRQYMDKSIHSILTS